ncbi:MAS-related GPR, member D [Pontoporia blainvillei]|uniref:MAS-related GPR, member D n=1 Tax=Pontoporia blainvillei TaxID=48723 RepID=A0ABX0SF57_PONBL|nr:MAS-related GPR, member D [Pontoporia blainvillei]
MGHAWPTRATWPTHEAVRTGEHFTQVAGLSLLTAISTQRCLSVLLPVWYECHRPRHLPGTVCVPLWAPSLLRSTLASLCSRFWHRDERQCFTVNLIVSILITGIFMPAMAMASLTLCTQVQRSSQRRRPTRLYVAILASVLVFVCVLPLGISGFLLYRLDLPQRMKTLFSRLARLSLSVSSSAKPVIYLLVGSRGGRACGSPWGPCCTGRCGRSQSWRRGRRSPPAPTTRRGSESTTPWTPPAWLAGCWEPRWLCISPSRDPLPTCQGSPTECHVPDITMQLSWEDET